MTQSTQKTEMTIINIADLRKEPDVTIVTEDDVRHVMKRATVGSFIDNIERVESLGVNSSTKEEMDLMIAVICDSFPTLTEDAVKIWPLEAMTAVSTMARGQSGEVVTGDADEAAAATASGNDQAAT